MGLYALTNIPFYIYFSICTLNIVLYSPTYNHNDNDYNDDDENDNNDNSNNAVSVRCVNVEEILEVKCPYSIRDVTVGELGGKMSIFH